VIDEQREHIKTLLAQSDAQQLTSFGNPPTYSHLLSASPSVDNTVGDKDILLSTSLFSYNQDFELLREHESPTSTYMKTQQQIVDGYRRALATSQASDL